MKSLTPADLQFVVARIPRDIRDVMLKNKIYVGGGFIRETIAGGEVKDIDMFGESVPLLTTIADLISLQRNARTHRSPNAVTVICPPRVPLQFITRWCFADALDLVPSFDFTVCQAAVWFDKGHWRSAIHDDFYSDLADRRLVYTFPKREEAAGGSMLRVRKFLQRGYNIQATSLAGVIARLAIAVDYRKANNEFMVAQAIAGLLHEVDPVVVIDGMDLIDEHEVIAQGASA